MSNPADTNWGVQSESEYGGKMRNYPLRLSDKQAKSQADEPTATGLHGPSTEIRPSRLVFQQRKVKIM